MKGLDDVEEALRFKLKKQLYFCLGNTITFNITQLDSNKLIGIVLQSKDPVIICSRVCVDAANKICSALNAIWEGCCSINLMI
jgi:hypothetical protein